MAKSIGDLEYRYRPVKMVRFINKNATSGNVGRSTPAERQLINEQSREHRGTARQASNRPNQRARARQRIHPEGSRQERGQPANRPSRSSGPDAGTTSASHGQAVFSTLAPQSSQLIASSNAIGQATIPHPGPGNPLDPFNVTSVPFNAQVVQVLRYFKQVYYINIWSTVTATLRGKIDIDNILRCSPEHIILECMENKSRMYCLLADVGCHMQAQRRLQSADDHDVMDDLTTLQMRLLHRGTESLRQDLVSKGPNIDSNILVEALHLYMAAAAISLRDAAEAHMTGARAIIRQMLRQGVPVRAPSVAMLALVDLELSCHLLRNMNEEALRDPTVEVRISLPDDDAGEVEKQVSEPAKEEPEIVIKQDEETAGLEHDTTDVIDQPVLQSTSKSPAEE